MTVALPLNRTMAARYGEAVPVAADVVRVLADNPGPFTFKGTNTYLVGRRTLTVIDPGPDDPAHLRAVIAAAAGRPITQILLTHAHDDHLAGLAALQAATGATCMGFAARAEAFSSAVGAGSRQENATRQRISERGIAGDDPGATALVDLAFVPDRPLADGDRIDSDAGELVALHTPGHAPDHLCFARAADRVLFSGDHVMGWSTSVVAPPEGSMRDYIAALERLLERSDRIFLSGHGETIDAPRRLVRAYVMHRRWREGAILDAIRGGEARVPAIVKKVYRGIAAELSGAAALSVLAHAEHLVERGLVSCDGSPSLRSSFSPT